MLEWGPKCQKSKMKKEEEQIARMIVVLYMLHENS